MQLITILKKWSYAITLFTFHGLAVDFLLQFDMAFLFFNSVLRSDCL